VTPHPRAGLALPAALFTIALIVLFIAGSAFAATQEARASAGAIAQRVALEAAEYGAVAVLRDWDRSWNLTTPVGQTAGPFTHSLAGGATAQVRLTRTGLSTWWVVSEGQVGSSALRAARRTINAVYRLELPPPVPDAALAVVDSAQVTGTGAVIGTDSTEVTGVCYNLPVAPIAGVAAPDTTRVTGLAGIAGVPQLATDSSIVARIAAIDSSLTADIVLPGGSIVTPAPILTAGLCDTVAVTNWGDPAGGPCGTRYPIIRVPGDLTVRGGTGQGILLVAGDVWFENGATFAGIVIARDDFVTGSGGASILGAVLAGDAVRGIGDYTTVGSAGRIRRSSCRIRQARLAAASPARVKQRWWMEFE
jgi:hypothetical protein